MINNLKYDFNISFTVDTKLPNWVEDELFNLKVKINE